MSLSFEDKRVKALGARFQKIYGEAEKGMAEKVNSFFANFKELDAQKKALVDAGKLSQKDYETWRRNKLLMGEKYKDLRDSIADNMLHANQRAAAVINHELPNVYAHNFNQVGEGVERKVKGYSFDLTNPETVRKLATDNTTLLPYKFVDGHRDVRWNSTKVNSQILQGVLQGESADQMASRLMNVTKMNKESALRNARTAVTSAQNKGRVDAMHQCEDDGVIMGKEWIATKDERTREAHLELDRVVVKVDEPFENEIGQIMYPGDPDADPANTYNCRCTIAEVVLGFKPKEEEQEEEQIQDNTEQEEQQSYYAPIDEMGGMSQEQKEAIEAHFVELDGKYHANVDGGVHGLLERDQAEYDLQFKNYKEHLLEENPRMRESTAEKRTKEIMGERPEYTPGHGSMRYLETGGEYRDRDNLYTMTENAENWQDFRHTITINPYSLGADTTLADDIADRRAFIERNAQRLEEGRTLRSRSNVGTSLEGTFIHEYGHAIDYTYGVTEHPLFIEFYESLSEAEIRSVSRYAETNPKEFMAEAFYESYMGDTQGDVSKRFMRVLEAIIK